MESHSESKYPVFGPSSSESDKPEAPSLQDRRGMKGEYRLGRSTYILLSLTREGLSWSTKKNQKLRKHRPLEDIFAVRQETVGRQCLGHPIHCMSVFTFTRSKKAPAVWKFVQLRFLHEERKVVREWTQQLQKMLKEIRERPRRLWVFVNPFGGSKSALKIWKRIVSPLFALAGIETEVCVTKTANEAYNAIQSVDVSKLNDFDGIIVVGGDGLFQEAMNGLLDKTVTSDPPLRIGHIPAGSTDAVAWSINGSRSVVSAALRVILGDRLALDVMHVGSDPMKGGRYAACLAGYGFMGDVITMSDRLRCLGPVRYDVAGVAAFLAHHKQRARISYVRAPYHDNNRLECRTDCLRCQEKKKMKGDRAEADNLSGENVETIEGSFVSIIIAVIPCRSDKSPNGLIPRAHLSDGRLHITLVKDCPRWRHLSFLLSIAKHGIIPGQHDFVHSIDAEWVQVEPIDGTSIWSIDGEIMRDQIMTASVHHGRLEVFARGVEK